MPSSAHVRKGNSALLTVRILSKRNSEMYADYSAGPTQAEYWRPSKKAKSKQSTKRKVKK